MYRTLSFLLLPMTPEDLRYEVRRLLYGRQMTAVDAAGIKHGLSRWSIEATEQEIAAACTFLAGLNPPQVTENKASLGSRKSWEITSAGILAYERNE
jgi:hypothetical protein